MYIQTADTAFYGPKATVTVAADGSFTVTNWASGGAAGMYTSFQ
jgi:hypothetical protein